MKARAKNTSLRYKVAGPRPTSILARPSRTKALLPRWAQLKEVTRLLARTSPAVLAGCFKGAYLFVEEGVKPQVEVENLCCGCHSF